MQPVVSEVESVSRVGRNRPEIGNATWLRARPAKVKTNTMIVIAT